MKYNFVAKYSRQFNKAVKMIDRKKAARRGYIKHKKKFMLEKTI